MHKKSLSSSFTLLELLIVMAVLAILASILLVVVKPQQIFAKARDSKRTADIAKIDKVIQIALSETSKIPLGTSNIIYLSLPAISGQTNCTGYSLPTPPSGWTYNCAIDPKKTDGTGWIPINLSTISTLNVDSLPQDPLNNTSYYYSYQLNATTTYKVLVNNYEAKTQIPQNGLVLYLSFDEGSGTIAYDKSGNGNNGTVQSGSTWQASCKSNSCLNFSNGGIVSVPNSSNLQVSGNLSLVFWAYPLNFASPGRQNPIDKAYWGEFALTIEPDASQSYFHGQGSYMYCGWGSIWENNKWIHIAIVRDVNTQTVKLYKNGTLTNGACNGWMSPSVTSGSVNIGRGYVNSFNGHIDEVAIYNRALSLDEIKLIYDIAK